MNYKTMRGLLALGIRVRHESWKSTIYLYKDANGYLMNIGNGYSPSGVNPNNYNPEYSYVKYVDKYNQGWEIYDESKINE